MWAVASDGSLVYICAHCKKVTKRFDVRETYTPELLMKQCKQSQAQHKTHCLRKRPYPESLAE